MHNAFKPRAGDGTDSQHRELALRFNGGVEVTLSWHPLADELRVSVCDERRLLRDPS
jgi:hypothetical protein